MKHVCITFTPQASVQFSLAEINAIIECSKRHYDGTCRRLSLEHDAQGRPGLAVSIRNIILNTDEGYLHGLVAGQIDIMLKCLEQAHHYPDLDQKMCQNLADSLRVVFKRLTIIKIQSLEYK